MKRKSTDNQSGQNNEKKARLNDIKEDMYVVSSDAITVCESPLCVIFIDTYSNNTTVAKCGMAINKHWTEVFISNLRVNQILDRMKNKNGITEITDTLRAVQYASTVNQDVFKNWAMNIIGKTL